MPKIYRSIVVNAPADAVWAVARDFNGLPAWIPAIQASEITNGKGSDQVGAIRSLTLGPDVPPVVETLLELSDANRSVTYDIVESPLGVENYVATLTVAPVTASDASFVSWTAHFDPAAGQDGAERAEFIGNEVFGAGLAALKAKLEG
ncbi:MAG: SRPBCC family protein [Thermoleophilia bacterium]